ALDNLAATTLVFGPLVGSVLAENRRFHGDVRRRWADRTYWQLQAWQLTGLVLGVLLAKRAPGAALPGTAWLWPVLGCAIGLAGVTLRWWAIRTLGAHFTRNLQIAADHEVVTDGPYRHLRHPSYTGAILMLTGVGIGLGNALSLAACLVLPAIGYIQRIPREEALLTQELGRPYTDYASHTRRLVPGVW
ncbi:MAG: methyltransferase family protein, partial [Bacteroidales bacterium]